MGPVVTLAERRRLKLDAMRAALPGLDAGLTDYAREHGGRFGSSATGRTRLDSDVDILADFAGPLAVPACDAADALCVDRGLAPDCRLSAWCSEALVARALAERRVLA